MAFGTKMPPSTSLFYSDFTNWKIKLCKFIEYEDQKLWNWFNTIDRYEQPRLDGVLKSRAQMSVNEREEFDKDNRAYEMITMCLPEVVINKFKNQETSTDLWDALIEAYDQKEILVKEEEDPHTTKVAQIKEVDSNAFECLSCFKLTGDNNRYRDDNENLRSNLENLTQANKVLKANELAYEKKFKAYQDEFQVFKAKIYSQQDAINSYLKEITLLKRELEDSKSELDDLKRKTSNFATSSLIFDHILDKQRTDTKSKVGLGYNHVPPPLDYLPMPNKDAIKDFVPSSSKVDTNSVNAPVNEQSKQVELIRPTFVKAENKPPVSVEEVVEVEDIPEVSTIKVEKITVKPNCFKCKGKAKVDNESFHVTHAKKDLKSKSSDNSQSTVNSSTSGTSTSTCPPKSACSANVPANRPSVYCPPPKRFEGTHWNKSFVERRSCFRCGQQGHIIRDCKLLSLDRFGRGMPRTFSFRNSFSKSFSRRRSYSPVSSCASNSPKPMARVNKVVPSRPQVQQHNIVENKSSKLKQVWKSKSTNNTSMKTTEFLKYHKLMDVMIMDDSGQPKFIKAWVSHKL